MPPAIGVFGGSFDPPHRGHEALACAALRQLDLDRLLWVLTPDPPHKQDQRLTPLEHRLAMVKHAISSRPGFILSTVEIERPGPHYALDTVEILSEQNPGRELAYIMGSDSLCDLPTWHRSLDLVSALGFIGVMRRPGDSIELSTLEAVLPGLTAKVRFIDSPPLQITSHEIRRLAAEGRPFRHLVLPAVYNYIIKNRLYRA